MRFSLLTVVLLFAIAALGITVGIQYYELRPLRKEVDRLRGEVGYYVIDDESQIHACRMPGDNGLEWTFRVYFPQGRSYYAAYKINNLTPQHAGVSGRDPVSSEELDYMAGFSKSPVGWNVIRMEPGERFITLKLERELAGGWVARFSSRGTREFAWKIVSPIAIKDVVSPEWPAVDVKGQGDLWVRRLSHFVDDGPFMLLTHRAFPHGDSYDAGEGVGFSSLGLRLWVGAIDEPKAKVVSDSRSND